MAGCDFPEAPASVQVNIVTNARSTMHVEPHPQGDTVPPRPRAFVVWVQLAKVVSAYDDGIRLWLTTHRRPASWSNSPRLRKAATAALRTWLVSGSNGGCVCCCSGSGNNRIRRQARRRHALGSVPSQLMPCNWLGPLPNSFGQGSSKVQKPIVCLCARLQSIPPPHLLDLVSLVAPSTIIGIALVA